MPNCCVYCCWLNAEVATWTFIQETPYGNNPAYLAVTYNANGVTRYYEHLPGSESWCRRSDSTNMDWSTFIMPLVEQYEGDFHPYTWRQ